LTALDYLSNSAIIEAGLSYPIIRSRERNWSLGILGFLSDTESETLGATNTEDRLRGVRLRSIFDAADELKGINQIIVTASQGFDGFGSTANANPLASRVHGRVDFSKVEGLLSRSQQLMLGWSMFGAFGWQYAFNPLLVPEECVYGGRFFGRAFDPAELSGDRCWSVLGEVRYDVTVPSNPWKQLQFYGFADHAELNRIAPASGTPKTSQGSSGGVGVRVGFNDYLTLDLQAAKPLEGRSEDGWRFFMVLSAHY
jgi:hemolysin activation/secretion protein